MRTIWHSLMWKEWHEHKWKLAAIFAILWGVTVLAMSFDSRQNIFAVTVAVVAICIVPLAVFVGLGAAASERSHGTLSFLQSLPVPMWRPAIIKLLIGLVSLIVPVVLTVTFFYIFMIGREQLGFANAGRIPYLEIRTITGSLYLDGTLYGALIAASFFIWASAAGVNRKDEISAGAVALTAMVGWSFILVTLSSILNPTPPWLVVAGASTAPGGFFTVSVLRWTQYLWLGIAMMSVTHFSLAAWYVRRFGRIANVEIRSPQAVTANSSGATWLAPPRRSALSAIAWKQFRESGPIAIAGVAGSLGIAVAAILFDRQAGGQWRVAELLGEVYPKMAVFLGVGVALVAGIGVCLNDVGHGLNAFWRSRPIQPDLWFWTKYATGLFVVLTSIYVPIGILAAIGFPVFGSWNFPEAAVIPAVQLAIFAAAVMATCLVRNAVYAAILSFATVYVGVLLAQNVLAVLRASGLINTPRAGLWEVPDVVVAVGFATSFVACTIVAWLAMRYDWGRKNGN